MIYLFFLLCYGVSYSCAVLERSQLETNKRVRYFVFTKDNRNDMVDIRDANFPKNVTTVFIIHGSTISLEKPWNLKDDLFEYEPNVGRVILVSWVDYSTYSGLLWFSCEECNIVFADTPTNNPVPRNYVQIASRHVPSLARDIYDKILYILKKGGGKIELIGHSLGAHVAGQSARLFKRRTGAEVHRIVGLDPVSTYFNEYPKQALQSSDAEKVLVLHTNTDRYGYKSEIGTNDIFVNGGKKQPECKHKLTDDICSHNQAWQAYSNYLKNETATRVQSPRYVLCLDVSASMDVNNRLMIGVESAKNVISSMQIGSYLGIVAFSTDAQIIHNIVKIETRDVRQSLVSSLPRESISSTSIGAGLRLSMDILQALPESEKFCPTIFLISDGEQNDGETPEDVLPDITGKTCIKVNSVALGAEASEKLEEISAKTKGKVFYVREDKDIQQIVDTKRAFSFSYESELDADSKPIYLKSKYLALSNYENKVSFFIDEGIGKDTEFNFISDDIKNVDVKLISPMGKQYSSSSPEYTYDSLSTEKAYKIDLAEPGQWNLIATKASRRKRSIETVNAIVTVKTHQLDNEVFPVRLDAIVTNQTLEYPKSITILAELRSGRLPVIHAEVIAYIEGMNQETISLHLKDDGTFPDELTNDGVYMASIIKLPKVQRYSVFVTASSNGTAKLLPKEIDYFERNVIDCERIACKTLNYFEREANVGSIKLLSNANEELIAPIPVTDLRATVRDEKQKQIALEWTTIDQVHDMQIKRYDIRALIDGSEFENALQFNETHVVEGSLGATNSTTGKVVLRIPDAFWKYDKKFPLPGYFLELIFALKTIGKNTVISHRSNLASVIIKDRPIMQIFGIVKRSCKIVRRRFTPFGWIAIQYCGSL